MLVVPQEYKETLQRIIAWHLKNYAPDIMFDVPTKRILEKLEKTSIAQLEDKELYYVNECVADAKNYVLECGVEQVVADEIFDWIHPEYKKTKQTKT